MHNKLARNQNKIDPITQNPRVPNPKMAVLVNRRTDILDPKELQRSTEANHQAVHPNTIHHRKTIPAAKTLHPPTTNHPLKVLQINTRVRVVVHRSIMAVPRVSIRVLTSPVVVLPRDIGRIAAGIDIAPRNQENKLLHFQLCTDEKYFQQQGPKSTFFDGVNVKTCKILCE